jgi:hypothetical protein
MVNIKGPAAAGPENRGNGESDRRVELRARAGNPQRRFVVALAAGCERVGACPSNGLLPPIHAVMVSAPTRPGRMRRFMHDFREKRTSR